jgi:hypothetical protein
MISQYQRIVSKIGGEFCTDKAFIKEARKILSEEGRSREFREARQAWLKQGLEYLSNSRAIFINNKL